MDKWVNAVPSTQKAVHKHRLKLVPLLGWNDLPCDPFSRVTSCFSHGIIMETQRCLVWPPHPMYSLSHQLLLRKLKHVRESGFIGMRLLGHGGQRCTAPEGNPRSCAIWQFCSDQPEAQGSQCHGLFWPVLSEALARPLGPSDQIILSSQLVTEAEQS